MGLCRLVYTSTRHRICTDFELNKILESCKKNNPGNLITGLLLHTDRRFIQVVEGAESKIEHLFETIKRDKRHGGVTIRHETPIKERLFPHWDMAYKDISSEELKYNTEISDEDKVAYHSMLNGDSKYSYKSMELLKNFIKISYPMERA